MICKNIKTNVLYNYLFSEGNVNLSNPNYDENFTVSYDEWLKNYYIIDKWKTIR
jgi:hypothetical protein